MTGKAHELLPRPLSEYSAMPAEQRFHAGTSTVLAVRHDGNSVSINGHSSVATQEPPPSYSTTDALSFASDTKHKNTDIEDNVAFADSPSQLPFDDLVGGSIARRSRRSLPSPPQQQQQQQQHHLTSSMENRSHSHNETRDPNTHFAVQEHSPDSPHAHERPELPHAPRSNPETKAKLNKISELEEVDPYGNKFHEESPFEAGRRAQRVEAAKPPNLNGQRLVNGRFPSVKPGEIMPIKTIWPMTRPPTFTPPLEAPPFPPFVQNPIRPAHFPPNLHPPPPEPKQTSSSSRQQPPPPQALPVPHEHRTAPSPSQPTPPPPNPSQAHSNGQPPRELLRSQSQHSVPHATPLPPQHAMPQDSSKVLPPPRPSRRHTFNARDGVPPGLAPNGRYPAPQPPPPPVPQGQQQTLYDHPPGPPSRSQSQHQHPQSQPRPAPRDPHRHSLPAPPPSREQFAPPPVPSPVRLPSQNVPTPQSLGIIHAPPPPSSAPRIDPSRPPRATPKPVMPQLLAPLAAAHEYDLGRSAAAGGGAGGPLHRSASSAAITAQKGGFLAKTKSILRKRSSTTGIKTHGDGAISFAPTMPNVMEEHSGSMLGKKLSKRK